MKPIISMLALAGVVTIVFTCCSANHKKEAAQTDTETTATEQSTSTSGTLPVSSSAAVATATDTEHKFIRTADIKFAVKDVATATYAIEDAVTAQGGYVTYTNLLSKVADKNTIQVSADSSLEVTRYNVTNSITLRVPNNRLDTTLKSIAQQVAYLDYRVIRADDVALQLLGNQLKQQRLAKHEKRLANAIDTRSIKAGQVTDAENGLLNKQEQADDAVITNLSTQNQISYSSVTLEVYQPTATSHYLIANPKSISAYQPGFATRLKDAAATGCEGMADLIIVLVRFWWLIVAVIVALLLYRRFKPLLTGNY